MKSAMTFAAALVCGLGLTVHAQDSKVKSKTRTDGDATPVTFTGCVQSGSETRTYILDKVVPVSRTTTTETTGTSGEVTRTSTTYLLVPGDKVELQSHVGHKVEVTGTLDAASAAAPVTADPPSAQNAPKVKVTRVKMISETCAR